VSILDEVAAATPDRHQTRARKLVLTVADRGCDEQMPRSHVARTTSNQEMYMIPEHFISGPYTRVFVAMLRSMTSSVTTCGTSAAGWNTSSTFHGSVT